MASMCGWRSSIADPASPPAAELTVGFVRRAHGLRGEVLVEFTSDRPERSRPGAVFSSSRGRLRIETARPKPPNGWLIHFAGITDRTAAEGLHGLELRAEPLDDPDEMWIHETLGAEVVDARLGSVGAVVAVEANPAADLLVLPGGRLIPVSFVVSHQPGRIEVDLPDGLLDL